MIYVRAFIVALFALTGLGPAHAQQTGTPAPQLVTPRINVGAIAIEGQPFFASSAPSSRKVEGSRPHPRHERCWNECRTQSCALVCQ